MDRSRHKITKYFNDEKTHKTIDEPLLKRLNTIANKLYEVDLLKPSIEHREPVIVGLFKLQYEKVENVGAFYNFFDKLCDANN